MLAAFYVLAMLILRPDATINAARNIAQSEDAGLPIRYTIKKELRLVLSIGEGHVTFPEVRAHQDTLMHDPDFDPAFNQLIDLTQTTALDMSASEAEAIGDRRFFSPSSRRAFVATKPAIYGLGRLMQVYQERHAQVGIFYDLRSALEWLGIPQDSSIFREAPFTTP